MKWPWVLLALVDIGVGALVPGFVGGIIAGAGICFLLGCLAPSY